jgi:hypothetical protein
MSKRVEREQLDRSVLVRAGDGLYVVSVEFTRGVMPDRQHFRLLVDDAAVAQPWSSRPAIS